MEPGSSEGEPYEAGLTHEDVRARSELARHLRGSLFPADRTTLIQFAVEEQLPPDLVTALRSLPPGRYLNVEGVWEALSGHREERLTHGADPGAVDRDAAEQPRVEESRPSSDDRERAEPEAIERFRFCFDLVHLFAAAPFLVWPGNADVVVDRGAPRPSLHVRFGPWRVDSPLDNVESTAVTGPYQLLKTVGPAHVSLADGGLTFATNDAQGVCIRFRDSVPGLDPFGLIHHRAITVTVADVDGLRAALAA